MGYRGSNPSQSLARPAPPPAVLFPKGRDSRLVLGALVTMSRSFGVRRPLIGCACDSNKCLMLLCLFSNIIYVTLGLAHLQDPWNTP